MLFLIGLMQLSVADHTTLMDGVAQLHVIDEELHDIQDNQITLKKSAQAREAEIGVLKRRYPDIRLSQGATVEQIYRALYLERVARADKLKPLAAVNSAETKAKACAASKRLKDMNSQLQNGGGLDKMTLKERLEWRRNMDDLTQESGCPQP